MSSDCGVIAVTSKSSKWAVLKDMGLTPNNEEHFLQDLVRSCPMCAAKKVYYDYLANKACLGCGARFINGQLLEVRSV